MRKSDIKDNKTLNEYYLKNRKIKFADSTKKIETVDDIIMRLWYKKESTLFVRNGIHSLENKYRSINDYISLCKNYFPKLSVKEVMNKFKEHQLKFKEYGLKRVAISYCPDIRMTNSGGISTHFGYTKPIYDIDRNIKLGTKLVINKESWDFVSNK